MPDVKLLLRASLVTNAVGRNRLGLKIQSNGWNMALG